MISCLFLGVAIVVAQTCSQTIGGQLFPKLIDVTLQDLQYGLEMGLFTSQDLVTAYLNRIAEVNETLHMVRVCSSSLRQLLTLLQVTEVNPDALEIAADLDKMRAAGNITG